MARITESEEVNVADSRLSMRRNMMAARARSGYKFKDPKAISSQYGRAADLAQGRGPGAAANQPAPFAQKKRPVPF